MSTGRQRGDSSSEPGHAPERTAPSRAETDVEKRADLEEDRRRQRELDDGELGGEA